MICMERLYQHEENEDFQQIREDHPGGIGERCRL